MISIRKMCLLSFLFAGAIGIGPAFAHKTLLGFGKNGAILGPCPAEEAGRVCTCDDWGFEIFNPNGQVGTGDCSILKTEEAARRQSEKFEDTAIHLQRYFKEPNRDTVGEPICKCNSKSGSKSENEVAETELMLSELASQVNAHLKQAAINQTDEIADMFKDRAPPSAITSYLKQVRDAEDRVNALLKTLTSGAIEGMSVPAIESFLNDIRNEYRRAPSLNAAGHRNMEALADAGVIGTILDDVTSGEDLSIGNGGILFSISFLRNQSPTAVANDMKPLLYTLTGVRLKPMSMGGSGKLKVYCRESDSDDRLTKHCATIYNNTAQFGLSCPPPYRYVVLPE